MHIYEHEAIRIPKSENNIGAPSAPQKINHKAFTVVVFIVCGDASRHGLNSNDLISDCIS